MSAFSDSPNHFLSSLSESDSALFQPHLRPMELPQGAILFSAEQSISRIYFPHGGVVSIVIGLSTGQYIEAGMFGRNSVIGVGALLGEPFAINQAIGQVGGSGLVGETTTLKRLVEQSETLRPLIAKYEQSTVAQIQQVAACNAVHTLEERLSRWLLQVRDLIQSEDLPLTQEFLSQMLAVQRSSVTLVARSLQEVGLITYRRGRIHIVDGDGLSETCCECHGAINAHFHRLIGWKP
ncbi:cyclic nucleotide-binding protein [Methylocella silvestris BL2]|uniref:Cyclic nucleotide-binding protein n=1 Tax=Methylocella silvestris (strain DSM 15510 / CIP 108128 / LMG 27833 / NCIMB 13906 / BL2) TaxID=395965 RepID=B8EJD2_METSB|nr:Crp/Fnr family transcriptional regulator [Methylocella silvestris]ACK52624.1 cyclic nucleotide-binding protein [Methylocella silvestris BL2]